MLSLADCSCTQEPFEAAFASSSSLPSGSFFVSLLSSVCLSVINWPVQSQTLVGQSNNGTVVYAAAAVSVVAVEYAIASGIAALQTFISSR